MVVGTLLVAGALPLAEARLVAAVEAVVAGTLLVAEALLLTESRPVAAVDVITGGGGELCFGLGRGLASGWVVGCGASFTGWLVGRPPPLVGVARSPYV